MGPQAQESQGRLEPPEVGKRPGRNPPCDVLTWTSGLQKEKTIHVCSSSPPTPPPVMVLCDGSPRKLTAHLSMTGSTVESTSRI